MRMATAMGVALAQGRLVSLAILTALGLGFAVPFVILTFAIGHLPALGRGDGRFRWRNPTAGRAREVRKRPVTAFFQP